MKNEGAFIKIAAICAFITAVTTFLLWLLPKLYIAPEDFDEAIALSRNSMYMARQWINLLHIPLALMAYFGLAYVLRKRELPKVGIGMIWFLIWGIVEMIGISGIIFSVNGNWRANYVGASSSEQEILRINIESYLAQWDSMFFVLLIAFLLGTAFYGWATWCGKGLERLLSYLFWLAAPLTILIILSGYFGLEYGTTVVGIVYPILQPVSRFVLGLFLMKNGDNIKNKRKHFFS